MNNKHLVLGMMLVSVSLSTRAYDGDLSDETQKALVGQFASYFESIAAELHNWRNGTNVQNPASQIVEVSTEPVGEAPAEVRSANIPSESSEPNQSQAGNQNQEPEIINLDQSTFFGGLRDQITSINVTKETLIKYGAGAIIAVTISGVTYVLYKNGSFKKFGTAVKNHPVLSTVIAAHVAFLAYLIHTGQKAPAQVVE